MFLFSVYRVVRHLGIYPDDNRSEIFNIFKIYSTRSFTCIHTIFVCSILFITGRKLTLEPIENTNSMNTKLNPELSISGKLFIIWLAHESFPFGSLVKAMRYRGERTHLLPLDCDLNQRYSPDCRPVLMNHEL